MIRSFLDVGLLNYLALAMLMFSAGITGIIISKNLIRIIMSMFLITTSIILHFTAFGAFCDNSLANANLINFFVILISLMQISVALAVFYKIYQTNEPLDVEKLKHFISPTGSENTGKRRVDACQNQISREN
jgi:NAD(P)H-quinone oxidoreductase subunit 4L